MEFATVALGTLLPKLAQLLQDEYNLQKGVRKDIQFLSSELEATHAALREVGKVPAEKLSEPVRVWARDVREVSYDMEDIADTFLVRVEDPDPPSKWSTKRLIKKMVKTVTKAPTRRGIVQDIKDIKERVREVAERRDRYKVDLSSLGLHPAIAPNKTPVDPRIIALYTKVTELVGIDKSKEEVITRLKEREADNKHKRIVSIAGFGGLGKTTLAKAVYDEIKGQFSCTAFVSVSRNPDVTKVLKNIMYELDKEKFNCSRCANLDEVKHLIDLVHEHLENKRYLIVIDDIWDIEPWKIIGCSLIENNMGSRIITTTRNIGVAEEIGGCYRLKPLSEKSSEILFHGRIFGSKDCPRQFFEVSKSILKKCGGVPLAIVTTSGLLAMKSENIKEWYDVCDSIGSGLGSNTGMDSMRTILLLSYYDLPPHFKTCLLYLSIFPEDYEISKDRLISRWLAEGFLQQGGQGDKSYLKTGESYFNELINRSLIQPTKVDMGGTPQACCVHDTVLDMIRSLSKEECFITTILGNGKDSLGTKVRMISLHNDNSTAWPTMNLPKLRSLTIFKPTATEMDPMPSLSCHVLRVLDLRDCSLNDLESLDFVGSLPHLRYLGLPSTGRKYVGQRPDKLPIGIGKLQFLQTLDFSKTSVEELPHSIIGLRQLMCLRGCDYTVLPDGLKNLTSLEVLEMVTVTSKCSAEELGHLTQLRVLEVKVKSPRDDDDGWSACNKALMESLGKLKEIESLHIKYSYGTVNLDNAVEPLLGNLCRLQIADITTTPTWIKPASLPVLTYLDIEVYWERSEDIQVLGTLPCLRHLRFSLSAYDEREVDRSAVGPDAFPCLVRCEFDFREKYHHVVPSIFPRGAMPRLEDLRFRIDMWHFCPHDRFTIDDLALSHLPSLLSVTVIIDREKQVGHEVVETVRGKLEHEAAVHPNHPRIAYVQYRLS